MMAPQHIQIAVALIRRDDNILLVQQQGPDDPLPTWALPGGGVEPGELPTEAVVREVKEETGVEVIDCGHLLYVNAGVDPVGKHSSMTFVFEVQEWRGAPCPADPDNLVLRACFLPMSEAVEKLEQLPWLMMREPILAHLRGELLSGALWLYHYRADGSAELVHVVGTNQRAQG